MWTDRFKRTYTIETAKSKDSLLILIDSRINEAKADKSWINLAEVNYARLQLNDGVLTQLKRDLYNPFYENPFSLIIEFEESGSKTLITAQATTNPFIMKTLFWSYLAAFIIVGLLMYLVSSIQHTLLLLFIGMIIIYLAFLIKMAWHGALIKRYLYNILKDLEIEESYILF